MNTPAKIGIALVIALVLIGIVQNARGAEYGTPPDYSKPWEPQGCQTIAKIIHIGTLVKQVGGDKDKWVRLVERDATAGGAESVGEMLWVIAKAWDRDQKPEEFFQECMGHFLSPDKPKTRS